MTVVATALSVHVDRWEWRQLVASKYGPASATTRHLLHTLALHMDQTGRNCWPSQSALAKRSALSPRAVKKHIAIAKRTFWLNVTEHHFTGQGWRRNSYVATVPAALHPMVQALKKGELPALWTTFEGGAPGAPTWGTSFPEVGHHVPPKSDHLTVSESVQRVGAVDKSQKRSTRGGAHRSTKDDLKNRSEKSGALRARIAAAARAVPTRSSTQHHALTDAELAAKVKKLRAIGQSDGDIRRALASHAAPAQLTRVLKSV